MSYSGTGNFGLLERGRFGTGLRSAGVEDDEDGAAAGGGQGGESGDKSGVGGIRQGEVKPGVSDGVIGSV